MSDGNDLIIRNTRAVLADLAKVTELAAYVRTAEIEFQALLDGAVSITERQTGDDNGIPRKATPAEAAAATLFCVRHGLTVARGHVVLLGGKLYVTAEGWEAAAENTGLFDGFDEPEPLTQAEREFLGVPDSATAAMKVRAYRKDRNRPSVGYGWWDTEKDYDGPKSVPGMAALTRAKRRALRSLFPLNAGGLMAPEHRPAEHLKAHAQVIDKAADEATAALGDGCVNDTPRKVTPRDRGEAAPARELRVDVQESVGGSDVVDVVDVEHEPKGEPGDAQADEHADASGAEAEAEAETEAAPPPADDAGEADDVPADFDRKAAMATLSAKWRADKKAVEAAVVKVGLKSPTAINTATDAQVAKLLQHLGGAK